MAQGALVAGLVGRTTILTGKLTFEGGTTRVAKLRAFAIVFAAAGAAHEEASLDSSASVAVGHTTVKSGRKPCHRTCREEVPPVL